MLPWMLSAILISKKDCVTATLGTPEQRLRHNLSQDYHPTVRPVLAPSDIINITFSFRFSRIVALDIKNQVLTTDAWIVQSWKNPYLKWDESAYEGLHTLQMSPNDVWVPDTVLYNNADEDVTLSGFKEKFKTYVMVYSDGTNKWMSPATFKSSCDMRVKFYPFDKQECKLTFGSWTYDSRLLRMINPAGKYSHSEKFIESGDWTLEDVTIETVDEDFDCCEYPFSNIIYSFHFRRKTLYHILYQILPCVVIILLVILNFIIPPDSGERISFCITILLSMSVYLLILADSLPETSDDVAILGLYYMSTIFLIGFSLVGTVVVLRCHFAERKPSASLVKFAKFVLRRNERKRTNNTVFVRSKSPSHPQETEENEVKRAENTQGADESPLQYIVNTMKEKRELGEWKDSWREIAEAMDRLLLVIFLILGISTTIAIWIRKP